MIDMVLIIDGVPIRMEIEVTEIETIVQAGVEVMIASMIEIDKAVVTTDTMMTEIDIMADKVVVDRMKMTETLDQIEERMDLIRIILQNCQHLIISQMMTRSQKLVFNLVFLNWNILSHHLYYFL